ncbi:MAG TPA: hypothetical protein HA230_04050 [Candidatus Aenigmarchaeota archaeon]|nr:hypothetical protein [Candidatus Aenigmarchaeota archaeon]
MSHRDPYHISRVRYQRRVDSYKDRVAVMTDDDIGIKLADYKADVGRIDIFLARIGLIREPAHIAAYRLELDTRSHRKKTE